MPVMASETPSASAEPMIMPINIVSGRKPESYLPTERQKCHTARQFSHFEPT
jgi:hypothetical protein